MPFMRWLMLSNRETYTCVTPFWFCSWPLAMAAVRATV